MDSLMLGLLRRACQRTVIISNRPLSRCHLFLGGHGVYKLLPHSWPGGDPATRVTANGDFLEVIVIRERVFLGRRGPQVGRWKFALQAGPKRRRLGLFWGKFGSKWEHLSDCRKETW